MKNIELLKEKINSGTFPKNYPHFGGANLIITDDSSRKFDERTQVIYTAHASALSWLIDELKTIYNAQLNSLNKYDFYPSIGELIQESVNANDDLFETMLYVVDRINDEWKTM